MKNYPIFQNMQDICDYVFKNNESEKGGFFKGLEDFIKSEDFFYASTRIVHYDQDLKSFLLVEIKTRDYRSVLQDVFNHNLGTDTFWNVFQGLTAKSILWLDSETFFAYAQKGKKIEYRSIIKGWHRHRYQFVFHTERANEKINSIGKVFLWGEILDFSEKGIPTFSNGKEVKKKTSELEFLESIRVSNSFVYENVGTDVIDKYVLKIREKSKGSNSSFSESFALIQEVEKQPVVHIFGICLKENSDGFELIEYARALLNGPNSKFYGVRGGQIVCEFGLVKFGSLPFFFAKSDDPYGLNFRYKKAVSLLQKKKVTLHDVFRISAESFFSVEKMTTTKYPNLVKYAMRRGLIERGSKIEKVLKMTRQQAEALDTYLVDWEKMRNKKSTKPNEKESLKSYISRVFPFLTDEMAEPIVAGIEKELDIKLSDDNPLFQEIIKKEIWSFISFYGCNVSPSSSFSSSSFLYDLEFCFKMGFDFTKIENANNMISLISSQLSVSWYKSFLKKKGFQPSVERLIRNLGNKDKAVFKAIEQQPVVSDERFGEVFAKYFLARFRTLFETFGREKKVDMEILSNVEAALEFNRYILEKNPEYLKRNPWLYSKIVFDDKKVLMNSSLYRDTLLLIQQIEKLKIIDDKKLLSLKIPVRDAVKKHDFLSNILTAYRLEEGKKKEKEGIEKREEKFSEKVKEYSKLEYHGDLFSIVSPKDQYEVITEGYLLKHCVAQYLDAIASGQSKILFLRQNDKPETPFVTVEVFKDRIKQVYGVLNTPITRMGTPQLTGFVQEFAKAKNLICDFEW